MFWVLIRSPHESTLIHLASPKLNLGPCEARPFIQQDCNSDTVGQCCFDTVCSIKPMRDSELDPSIRPSCMTAKACDRIFYEVCVYEILNRLQLLDTSNNILMLFCSFSSSLKLHLVLRKSFDFINLELNIKGSRTFTTLVMQVRVHLRHLSRKRSQLANLQILKLLALLQILKLSSSFDCYYY